MIICVLLYLFFSLNLITVITEKSDAFYRDVRFWLVIISLVVLVIMTAQTYPV